MSHKFAEIAFTDAVKAAQLQHGSRQTYARREGSEADFNDRLGPEESAFITERDSFYMASVSETGWPYIQHRGGPKGFLKVFNDKHIGFADFAGNRQYISVGNFAGDNRVSLFLMDYPNRVRLKILGHARTIGPDDEEVMCKLTDAGYSARIERGFVISIEAFDWNCPQHITPRFSAEDVTQIVSSLTQRIAELEAAASDRRQG